MATLIPSISTCTSRMTSGERRVARRIQCVEPLLQPKLPFNVRKRTGEYNLAADAIQIMTMEVSKGLEFPVVALPGVGHMHAKGEDEQEAARVLYVAAARATQRLVLTMSGVSAFSLRLRSGISESIILSTR